MYLKERKKRRIFSSSFSVLSTRNDFIHVEECHLRRITREKEGESRREKEKEKTREKNK